MEKLDYQDQQDKQDHQGHAVSEDLRDLLEHPELWERQELLDLREVLVNKADVVLLEPRVQVVHPVHPDPKARLVIKEDKERQVQPAQKVQEV